MLFIHRRLVIFQACKAATEIRSYAVMHATKFKDVATYKCYKVTPYTFAHFLPYP